MVFGVGPYGQIFALHAKTGKLAWQKSLDDLESPEPTYGWATSPLVAGDVLIVQTGIEEGKAVTGFNKNTGDVLWTAGDDTINYQSPALLKIHGELQIVCLGDNSIFALDPDKGTPLWTYRHEGKDQASNPVPMAENQIFVRYSRREGQAIEIEKGANGFTVKELWKSPELKNTDTPSVYHDGRLIGYSGQFLTCADATTGEQVWRSRTPGDGFPMMVNDYLVVMTKKGSLHGGTITSTGFSELANIKLFEGLGWNPPSFAYGKIFVRNLSEIACIEIGRPQQPIQIVETTGAGKIEDSEFAAYIKKVEAADNKKALVNELFNQHQSFPIIENEKMAHVVYRGDVKDIAITGDMLDAGESNPLNKVKGSDLYYYSIELEPDAIIAYGFQKDFEENITDPLNPVTATNFGVPQSILTMPKWEDSEHLAEFSANRGAIQSFEHASTILENSRQVQVYLPSGYATGEERYPVIYVHYGNFAIENGLLPRSLDNLIGNTVQPTIAVFIHINQEAGFGEVSGPEKDKYSTMLTDELVPLIDKKYRTQTARESRVLWGASAGSYLSIYTAFKHPELFGWVVGHSTNVDAPRDEEIKELISSSDVIPTQFFLHWGLYDVRIEQNNIDRAKVNRELFSQLEEKGYEVHGGEMNHGYGWGSWRTINDTILETLFPAENKDETPDSEKSEHDH